MTAEVAVMNAQAVALAADSAVTIDGGAKTFTSAEKIFGLSAQEPVAVMIHGNSTFMGVPWETIAKSFRRRLGRRAFATLDEYAQEFIKHVKNETCSVFNKENRAKQARVEMRARLGSCFELFENELKVGIEEKGFISGDAIPLLLEAAATFERYRWRGAPMVPGLTDSDARDLVELYANDARAVRDDLFLDFPITDAARDVLDELCGLYLTRMFPNQHAGHTTGVVFAGFGREEPFPHVVEYIFDGIVGDTLRCCERKRYEVSLANTAEVIAFAQTDMVKAFMDGIDPRFKDEISDSLRVFLSEYSSVVIDSVVGLSEKQRGSLKDGFRKIGQEAFQMYRRSMKDWRRREYADKTLAVIRALPKDELATVAESLVSLTSLKRRVSMDASVAAPIDVCVISKYDGCVWVKKKHYFPIELNPYFFERRRLISDPMEDGE